MKNRRDGIDALKALAVEESASLAVGNAAYGARQPRALACRMEDGGVESMPADSADSTPQRRTCDFPGCDGNGRAIGGLAAIELFSWWPIKAYRPCPKCAEAGVRYSRSGQSLDEIVFKKNPKAATMEMTEVWHVLSECCPHSPHCAAASACEACGGCTSAS